jgi:hypothetical protein
VTHLRRLLDPQLGARVRAVLRTLGAIGTLGALAANAEEIAAALTAAQALLALLVASPYPTSEED